MALNIKDPATEQLARELATLLGTKLTQAVKVALEDRIRAEQRKRDRDARLARVRAMVAELNSGGEERPSSDHCWLYDEQGLSAPQDSK